MYQIHFAVLWSTFRGSILIILLKNQSAFITLKCDYQKKKKNPNKIENLIDQRLLFISEQNPRADP